MEQKKGFFRQIFICCGPPVGAKAAHGKEIIERVVWFVKVNYCWVFNQFVSILQEESHS